MTPALLVAATLPVLFWQESVNTRGELENAGIHHVTVSSTQFAAWRNVPGLQVDAADLGGAIKVPVPGIALRADEASASHIPWVTSNGWHFLRQPDARFYYDVPADCVTLAAAEAFSFGVDALIHTGVSGLPRFTEALKFLTSINTEFASPIADIGVIDDGSNTSREVMNLMVRDNLLFDIARTSPANYKLNIELGSATYSALKDPEAIVHKIRADLGDDKRSVRLFGTSVVVAHLTGEREHPRLHLLNYGAPAHIEVGSFRVRVLGRYSKALIRSVASPDEKLLDYEVDQKATEFTVPDLKTYAVVDFQ